MHPLSKNSGYATDHMDWKCKILPVCLVVVIAVAISVIVCGRRSPSCGRHCRTRVPDVPGRTVWGEHERRTLWSTWCHTSCRCYSSRWWPNHPHRQTLLLCMCVNGKATSHGAHLSCWNPGL